MSTRRRAIAVAAVTVLVVAACGDEDGDSGREDATAPRPGLSNAFGRNGAVTGVAQLDGLGSNCTGFLLALGPGDGPAHLLTNGHCVGLFDATTVLFDVEASDGAIARFGRFVDTPDGGRDVAVTSVAYASMRATDVAIVELAARRDELEAAGVASYRLGPPPAEGHRVRVVGVPVSGIDPEAWFLRGDTCTAGRRAGLVEWEWRWDVAVSTDCTGIVGGSSGSPAFDARDARAVVGIVNTTTIAAGPGGSCYLGQPCEITADGAVEVGDRTYLMPVEAWAACWPGGDGALDLDADGCPAERPPIVTVDAPLRAVRPLATWSATIAVIGADGSPQSTGDVVAKSGPVATTDCRNGDGYAPSGASYDDPLPAAEGVVVLCAALLVDGRPDLAGVGYAVMDVDAAPPVGTTRLSTHDLGAEGVSAEPVFEPPERSGFLVKVGRQGATDCDDEERYSIYRRVALAVPAADLPATFCVVAEDEAGNRGAAESFALPAG